jgi:hypothetical protein
MIKEFGENYDESEFKHKDITHSPRRRLPWPVLKVPAGYIDYSQRRYDDYGIIDQGCECHHSSSYKPKLLSKEKITIGPVDEEFDKLVESVLGIPNDGIFMRNDPSNLVRDSDGRAYTLLFAPHHRDGLRALANGINAPPQFMRLGPFAIVQVNLAGMHVLTTLDDDALDQLGGPSLPNFLLQSSSADPPPSGVSSCSGTTSGGGGSGEATSSDVATANGSTKTESTVPITSLNGDVEGSDANVKMNDNHPTVKSDIQDSIEAAKKTHGSEAENDSKHEVTPAPLSIDDLTTTEEIAVSSPYSVEDLPKLAEHIPFDWFPDYLHVNDPQSVTFSDKYTYGYRNKSYRTATIIYKRMYPKLPRDDPPLDASKDTANQHQPNVAHLHLAQKNRFGVGNHSIVHHAPVTLPKPLSAHSRDGRVVVAAKSAFRAESARQLLQQEAKMYNLFPQHLSEDWCGYNFVTPIRHPVPAGPVVPKFYGYYVPVKIVDGKEVMWDELDVEAESPLLLLEECGEPVKPDEFTADMR